MSLKIKEVYDGRLPEYQVLKENDIIIKSFDSLEEAEQYVLSISTLSCGEENPCI